MSDRIEADEDGRSRAVRAQRIVRALQLAFFAFVIPFIVQSTWLVMSQAFKGKTDDAKVGSPEWSPCR
jgi:hypothetical protein